MTNFRRFTGLQYYLAHARNTVHVVVDLPRAVTEESFLQLVGDVVEAAPQLMWRESLQDNGHDCDATGDWHTQCAFQEYDNAQIAARDLSHRLGHPLHDTGKPAFRALCQIIPSPNGPQSRIVFQTTHALMEGGDVADLLRGRDAIRSERSTISARIPVLARLGVWLVIPLLWVINLSMAAFEKTDRADFAMARILLDRTDLKRVAKGIGISQRDLLFALTTHHRKPGKKGIFAAYSNRPAARVHLCDDEYLTVRMDEVRIPKSDAFETYAKDLATTLKARGPSPLFTQMWYRRITQVHRWLHPRAPWLYPRQLFGFAPYDVILSLLPPVRVGRNFPLLAGSRIFAGSNTGTAESCIFAMGPKELTISLWSGAERESHVAAIRARAAELGIDADVER